MSPINGHTKLQLEEEGLEIIRNLEGPFSPVVVIGPYRSGKSFLLNQVLGVGCGESTSDNQKSYGQCVEANSCLPVLGTRSETAVPFLGIWLSLLPVHMALVEDLMVGKSNEGDIQLLKV